MGTVIRMSYYFFNYLRTGIILTLNRLTDNEVGDPIRMVSLRVAQNGPEKRSTMYNYECFNTTPLGRYETIEPRKWMTVNKMSLKLGYCEKTSTTACIYKIRPFLTAAQTQLCRGNDGQLLHQQPYVKWLSRVRALVLHDGPGKARGPLRHPAVCWPWDYQYYRNTDYYRIWDHDWT
jgi:hypothetical protein